MKIYLVLALVSLGAAMAVPTILSESDTVSNSPAIDLPLLTARVNDCLCAETKGGRRTLHCRQCAAVGQLKQCSMRVTNTAC